MCCPHNDRDPHVLLTLEIFWRKRVLCHRLQAGSSGNGLFRTKRRRCSPSGGHVRGSARSARYADESYAHLVCFLEPCAEHRLGLDNFLVTPACAEVTRAG